MTDVFVSYKKQDRARVKLLVDALTADGLAVWWDVAIEGGATWRQQIQHNLDAAKCVIVMWSTASVGPAGHFVHDEAARANRHGVFLPVAIDAVEPPLGFGQHQVLPLIGWTGNRADMRYQDVLAAVTAKIKGGPAPIPKAPRQALETRHWKVPTAIAVGFAVVLTLMVVLTPARLCSSVGLSCTGLAGPARTAPANSIAVLPFANLSGDPSQDYFTDGLSDELIGALARLEALQVAARTSSFKFKGSKDDSKTIGSKLGVAYILDGSMRRNGALVRVSAQLVDAKTGFERWSQTYDRDAGDVFAVQSGIATAVAEALKVRLVGGDIAALSRGGTTNPAAYDAYLRGRRLFDLSAGEMNYREALAYFDAAILDDPHYAAAHAARARVLLTLANQFTPRAELRTTYDAALKSARRAVELAPDLAEAQATLATALVNANLDIGAARQAYARARQTGSGNADMLVRAGMFDARTGNTAAGLKAIEHAVTLDPLNPRVFKSLGNALMIVRLYPDAIAAMHRALDLSPGVTLAHATIGDALVLQGRYEAAKSEYALEPLDYARLTGQAIVLDKLHDRAGANAALKALVGDDLGNNAYQQAQVYAQWGDTDRALKAIDAAFAAGDTGVLELATDPLMDPLRSEPGYAARIERLGFSKTG
jgi:TolB-like protein/Tfp pilus assembly protein PilF